MVAVLEFCWIILGLFPQSFKVNVVHTVSFGGYFWDWSGNFKEPNVVPGHQTHVMMYHLVPSQLTSLFASPLWIVHVHCMHGTSLQIWQTPDVKVASWLVCLCPDGAVLV